MFPLDISFIICTKHESIVNILCCFYAIKKKKNDNFFFFIHKCIYVIQILVSLAYLLKSLQHIEV